MSKRDNVFLFCAMMLIFIGLPSLVHAQADTIRLTCVGNSITEGVGTSNEVTDSYPAQLGALLGSGWAVKNSGVSGRTMLRHGDFPIWNEQRFADGIAFHPNIVTILLGTNDSKSWNWIYKDEFVPDYTSMIDTFLSLPSHPTVWLGLPPPSFSDAFGISDSVINTDIIPMIRQLAVTKGCPILDFNTSMKSDSAFFLDGIHPNTAGAAIMAETLYTTLTYKPISYVIDENVAAGKLVAASGSIDSVVYGGSNLVDSNLSTVWKSESFPSQAVIDLGSIQNVDLFQIDFAAYAGAGYKFLIETSLTMNSWTTALDRTTRTDTAEVILEKTKIISAQYIRLTVTGAVHPKGDTVAVADFRVFKANGGAHKPVISSNKISQSSVWAQYNINVQWPNNDTGAIMLICYSGQKGSYNSISGYVSGKSLTISNQNIKVGTINKYFAVSFANGVKTVSDTAIVNTNATAVNESGSIGQPEKTLLFPCYPDPFNPTTKINFTLNCASHVKLKVFNVFGQTVRTLIDGQMNAGAHTVTFDAAGLASGIYFYGLEACGYMLVNKMVLLK